MIQRGILRHCYHRRTVGAAAILDRPRWSRTPAGPKSILRDFKSCPGIRYSSTVPKRGTSEGAKSSDEPKGRRRNEEDYKNQWKAWFSSPEYQPTYSIPPISGPVTNNINGGKGTINTAIKSNRHTHQSIIQLENIQLDNMAKSLLLLLQHVSNNFIMTQEEQHQQQQGQSSGGGGSGVKMYLNKEQRRQKIILEQYDYPTTERCNSLLSTLLSKTASSSTTTTAATSLSSKSQIAFQLFYLMNYVTSIKQNTAQLEQSSRPNYDTFFKVLQLHSRENFIAHSKQDHVIYYSPTDEDDDILHLIKNINNNTTTKVMEQTSIWSSTSRRALYILNTMKKLEEDQYQYNKIAAAGNGSSSAILLDRIKVDVVIYNQVLATIANSLSLTKAPCCEALLQEMIAAAASTDNNSNLVDVSSYGYVFKACVTSMAGTTATDKNDTDDQDYVDRGDIALRTWKSFESSELLRELISSSSISSSPSDDKEDDNGSDNNADSSMHQYSNTKNTLLGATRGPQMIVYAMKSLPLMQKANKEMMGRRGEMNCEDRRIDVKKICMEQFDIACQLGWVNSHVLLAMDENLPRELMNELLFDKYTEVTKTGRNGGKEITREERYGQLFKRIPDEWKRNTDNVNQWGFNERRNVTV